MATCSALHDLPWQLSIGLGVCVAGRCAETAVRPSDMHCVLTAEPRSFTSRLRHRCSSTLVPRAWSLQVCHAGDIPADTAGDLITREEDGAKDEDGKLLRLSYSPEAGRFAQRDKIYAWSCEDTQIYRRP